MTIKQSIQDWSDRADVTWSRDNAVKEDLSMTIKQYIQDRAQYAWFRSNAVKQASLNQLYEKYRTAFQEQAKPYGASPEQAGTKFDDMIHNMWLTHDMPQPPFDGIQVINGAKTARKIRDSSVKVIATIQRTIPEMLRMSMATGRELLSQLYEEYRAAFQEQAKPYGMLPEQAGTKFDDMFRDSCHVHNVPQPPFDDQQVRDADRAALIIRETSERAIDTLDRLMSGKDTHTGLTPGNGQGIDLHPGQELPAIDATVRQTSTPER